MTIKPAQFDKAFSRLLARRGLLSTDEIYKVARIAVTRRDIGEACTMADVCRELLFLGPRQIDELVREIRLVTFICPDCDATYRVLVYEKSQDFNCKKCGGALAARDAGESAEQLVHREHGQRKDHTSPPPGVVTSSQAGGRHGSEDIKETTRKVRSERRQPRSLTRRIEAGQSETGILMPRHDPQFKAVLDAQAAMESSGPSPAPLPGGPTIKRERPTSERTALRNSPAPRPATTDSRPPAAAPAPAAAGASPLQDLPELRSPGQRKLPSDVWNETSSPSGAPRDTDYNQKPVDLAALEMAGDDAYARAGSTTSSSSTGSAATASATRAAMGLETAVLDDYYDHYDSMVAIVSQSEPDVTWSPGRDGIGDSALFVFDDIGLVDVAAVNAEVAAEWSERDTQHDMGVRGPTVQWAESGEDDPASTSTPSAANASADESTSFDFDDDDAFTAALQEAVDVESESDSALAKPASFASREDLLAAISEVEQAFATGNVEKRGMSNDPWSGAAPGVSVNVASPHIAIFRPPTDTEALLDMNEAKAAAARKKAARGSSGSSSGVQLPTLPDLGPLGPDAADPLASSLELPPPVDTPAPGDSDPGESTVIGDQDPDTME
ncbi:MAG: hypothetical protein AB7K09_10065 [Planctomycetota bacterium]